MKSSVLWPLCLFVFLSACQQPPALCRSSEDCSEGASCQKGLCLSEEGAPTDAGATSPPLEDAGETIDPGLPPPDTRPWVWTEVETPNRPQGSESMGMVYDAAASAVMLIRSESYSSVSEAWLWNGTQWAPIQPPAFPPMPRFGFSMIFDVERQFVMLYGGRKTMSDFHTDTWLWKDRVWKNHPTIESPGGRDGYAMAYDKARKETILFGGLTQGTQALETWTFDGTTWKKKAPFMAPPARRDHAMAYDEARGEIVLFGGFRDSDTRPLGDTWLWNGENWRPVDYAVNAVVPRPRFRFTLTYNPKRARVMLFGGDNGGFPYQDDLWEWDGQRWTEVAVSAPKPAARRGHRLVCDEKHEEMILFGSASKSDTWKFSAP